MKYCYQGGCSFGIVPNLAVLGEVVAVGLQRLTFEAGEST